MGDGMVPVGRQPFVFSSSSSRYFAPRDNQQKALLLGIVKSRWRVSVTSSWRSARPSFSWVFFIFGCGCCDGILPDQGGGERRSDEGEYGENALNRAVCRVLPITDGFVGNSSQPISRRTYLTPRCLWSPCWIGGTLMFAFDSIPA